MAKVARMREVCFQSGVVFSPGMQLSRGQGGQVGDKRLSVPFLKRR